ncbi:ATPase [Novosphingobium sp. Gsoil 351]|uniref:HdaA/DnaA family protein n=1 Tax=Novosphingobium sp. Gsoil 351 TaxID=2675225 RepID=UPI0012B4DE0A|nr:ATPase [Novosphingobium sp. Gsoil 351]QGN53689.1 ATPase [Novosphingobium sp. Gsoil 351]
MAQFALPLTIDSDKSARIVIGPSNAAVVDAFTRAADWPFRTAILTGPPRSGKSLLARWFVENRLGEAIDDADIVPEDDLFHRWNRAQASAAPLLLVTSCPPGEWTIALPDLASRLGAALLLSIGTPDDAMLAALIDAHAARRGLVLGEGAATWLLPRIERSHAAVEGVVAEIDRLSLERKQAVTISLLREALAPQVGESQPRLL